jgi:hypothetical protein
MATGVFTPCINESTSHKHTDSGNFVQFPFLGTNFVHFLRCPNYPGVSCSKYRTDRCYAFAFLGAKFIHFLRCPNYSGVSDHDTLKKSVICSKYRTDCCCAFAYKPCQI